LGYREGYLVGIRRPSTYSYPPKFNKLEDAENYSKRLYAELLENDSRGEEITARATDKDLKELIVRPEWYGAKGDGIHDDTAAIQAAVDVCLSKTSSYSVLTPQSLGLSGKYRLTASVNIDRLVDWQLSDFRIIGMNKSAGFYADTAINMFSSTLVNAAAPVSEFINFENVYFEGSSETLGAMVLSGNKFLRIKFANCRFYRMNLLTSSLYVQSIYLQKCSIRNVQGIFLNCVRAYDVSFEGNLIEFTGTIFKDTVGGTLGFRFMNNLCENTSATPIITYGLDGSSIVGNYFEMNTGPDIDFSPANYFYHRGVLLAGNHFIHSATELNDTSYYAVAWGDHVRSASSIGNRCNVRLHDLSGIGTAKFSSIGDSEIDSDYLYLSDLLVGAPSAAVELLTNVGFDSDTTGWTPDACTIASVPGGQPGNCLEITRVSGDEQNSSQNISALVIGASYTFSGWVKSGTSGNETFFLRCYQTPYADNHEVQETTSSTWTKYSFTFTATATSYDFLCRKYSATPGTMLFDTLSLQRNVYSPAEKVDVNGNINASGVYKVANAQIAQKDILGLLTTDSPTFDHLHLTTGPITVAGTQVIGEQQTGVAAMTNLTAPANLDADTVTTAELADIVGNLIDKLRVHGIVTT
jgi:hypothetical protein